MEWVNALFQGVLLGGLYALFAAGLSLIFGIMRLVNIAHGDFIVLAAYLAMVVVKMTGLHPLFSLVIVVPLMAGFGYVLQRYVLNPTLGKDPLPPLLVTFGLSVILQNGLLTVFSADTNRLNAGSFETASINIVPGLTLGVLPLAMFGTAVLAVGALEVVFRRTSLGRSFRATSDDAEIAQLMALNKGHVFALAMALTAAIIAIAGVFLAIRTNFDPASGPPRLLFGFEAVIIGGLGNLWGTLVGGIILGTAQTLGAQISAPFQILAGHLVFFLILALRPRGLFPRMD
jgi:branched-chain amino acid transport system permease protein